MRTHEEALLESGGTDHVRGVFTIERRFYRLLQFKVVIDTHFRLARARKELGVIEPQMICVGCVLVHLEVIQGLELAINYFPHSQVLHSGRDDQVSVSRGEAQLPHLLPWERKRLLEFHGCPINKDSS